MGLEDAREYLKRYNPTIEVTIKISPHLFGMLKNNMESSTIAEMLTQYINANDSDVADAFAVWEEEE